MHPPHKRKKAPNPRSLFIGRLSLFFVVANNLHTKLGCSFNNIVATVEVLNMDRILIVCSFGIFVVANNLNANLGSNFLNVFTIFIFDKIT